MIIRDGLSTIMICGTVGKKLFYSLYKLLFKISIKIVEVRWKLEVDMPPMFVPVTMLVETALHVRAAEK